MLCTLGFLYYITGICNFGGGGKGSWGAASELLEVAKQEESLLQKTLLLLEKKNISEFHGKQSINDYSASFLYELSFASVF